MSTSEGFCYLLYFETEVVVLHWDYTPVLFYIYKSHWFQWNIDAHNRHDTIRLTISPVPTAVSVPDFGEHKGKMPWVGLTLWHCHHRPFTCPPIASLYHYPEGEGGLNRGCFSSSFLLPLLLSLERAGSCSRKENEKEQSQGALGVSNSLFLWCRHWQTSYNITPWPTVKVPCGV